MTELHLILHVNLETCLTIVFLGGRGGPHNWPARSPELSPLDYCVWEWMKELVYNVKAVTRDALLGRILDAADRIRNSQQELERASRALHNQAAACVAAGGGIFEHNL